MSKLKHAKSASNPIDARAIRLRAIRRLGQMIGQQDKATGTRGNIQQVLSGGLSKNPPDQIIGLSKNKQCFIDHILSHFFTFPFPRPGKERLFTVLAIAVSS
jgi:hypothetical protein